MFEQDFVLAVTLKYTSLGKGMWSLPVNEMWMVSGSFLILCLSGEQTVKLANFTNNNSFCGVGKKPEAGNNLHM